MKKVLITLFILIILIGGILTGSLYVYHSNAARPLQSSQDVLEVTVAENESLYLVIDRLSAEGIVKNSWLTKLYYRLSGLDLEIESGRHEVAALGSLKEVLVSLQSENLDNVRVTIPEGLTMDNIASRLEKAGLVTRTEFLEAVKTFDPPDYVPELGERRYRMEGFLKPDTYTFTKGTSAQEIIEKMSREFLSNLERILSEMERTEIRPSQYDEIITKAAMIERETNNPEERALVASVIENRLAIDMKLQLDATVLYALGVDSKAVTYADMALKNPFNTYHVKALPAGPICNPSSAAIQAVLEPEETDYIYYLLNPRTQKHFFTDDYDEFLTKKREFANGGPILTVPDNPATKPVDPTPRNPYEGPQGLPFEIIPATKPATTPGSTGSPSVTTPGVTAP